MKIGFLGLGKMGTPMVRRLLAAGHSVTVWNRTRNRAEELTPVGALVAATPAEAAQGQDAVFSSLKDDASYEEVFFGTSGNGADGLMEAFAPGQLHLSLSTLLRRCASLWPSQLCRRRPSLDRRCRSTRADRKDQASA